MINEKEEQLSLDLGDVSQNRIAITGKLSGFTRNQAHELITLLDGISDQAVTKKSRYLVAGKQTQVFKVNATSVFSE